MVREERALADVRFAWRGEVTDDELVTLTQSHGGGRNRDGGIGYAHTASAG